MKMLTLAKRNAKEIVRDPLNLFFGLGFPLVLLFLLTAIQANIPVDLFRLEHLTPGITVFGLSFMTLFSAMILAKDRSSSLLLRLYTTPLKAKDFILGYTLPMIPMALLQSVVCYVAAWALGMKMTVEVFYAILFLIPISVFFIALGLLFGSVLTDKQAGGICGALLTNLCAWLSGIWFDLDWMGGTFRKIASMLPFLHAVELERSVLNGRFEEISGHLAWVLAWTVLVLLVAIGLFLKQMKKQ